MTTKIEDIWKDFEVSDTLKTGVVLKRYSADIRPNCFVAMRMPEKIKSIAFRLSKDNIDISALNDLKDITTEILPDDTQHDKMLLLISLADNSLSSIFAVLCEDLFNLISDVREENELVRSLQNRFLKWKELFELANSPGLSPEKQIGLFGELFLLKKLFIETENLAECLNIWVGPDTGIRDFEKNNNAIEVKTTQTHNHQKIKISSERQLDTTLLENLFLFHLSLEKRNSNENSLNKIVSELFSIIGDNKLFSNVMNRKLISAGYFKHHEIRYENISYLIRGEDFYKVKENFPRIEENNLMKGVGDVKYSIVLTAETEIYKTSLSNVIEKLKL
ncbi:PD-(D/E)XK motif protein [Geofilum sp. OHC36d9]|uniref:PD-(D/E)XK motif protein n=1 Tax=Geofilum sp. OHC36d9 TaxID=3458413 RepID=UPI004034EE68